MSLENVDKLSDKKLLSLIGKGNEFAFSQLFDRYWRSLLSSALKVLNDEQAAEDVVQEVFIDLWNRRADLKITNLKGYLHTAIRYQTAKLISRTKFTADHEEVLQSVEAYTNPERGLHLDDLNNQIDASLSKLTPRCKEIFVQSRFENLSNKEIAERNGISIRTVENYLTSALSELRLTLGNGSAITTIAVTYCLI